MLGGTSCASDMSSIRAKVLDVDGKPVAGAKIFVYQGSNVRKPADFISAPSDSSGLVVVVVPPGKYRAVARIKQGPLFGPLMPGDRHSGEPTEIEVEKGSESGADFVVADIREIGEKKRTTAGDALRLHGRVVDAEGNPVAHAYAFAQRTKNISAIPEFISAWTDQNGVYELYLPEAGNFFVGAARQFPLPPGLPAIREIGVPTGKSDVATELRITVY